MGCCGGVSSARLHGRHTLAQSERLKLQLASGPDDETVHVGQQSTSLHQGVCGMYSRCSPAIHSLGYPCTDLSSLNNSERAFDDPNSATGGVQRISSCDEANGNGQCLDRAHRLPDRDREFAGPARGLVGPGICGLDPTAAFCPFTLAVHI